MKFTIILTFLLFSSLVFTASAYAFSFGDITSWLTNFFRITGYTTLTNETLTTEATTSLLPCPYECCSPDKTYQARVCEYPKTCIGNKCADTTTTTAVCAEASRKCLGDAIAECINGNWFIVTTLCQYGCTNGYCNSEPASIIEPASTTAQTTTAQVTTTQNYVKEQVKCIFTDTSSEQKCYGNDGKFGCYGLGSCIAGVTGEVGTRIVWKSSCPDSGYTETTIDGNTKYVAFKCAATTQAATQTQTTTTSAGVVREQVKCVFANSVSDQKCFNEYGQTCGGTGTCVVDVVGEKGRMLTWKSTCGGYAYTMMDGINEYAEFNCQATTQTTNQTSTEAIPVSTAIQTSQPVKEQVQCRFLNSEVLFNPHTATPEKCYSERFGCLWDGNVATEESGKKYAYCVVGEVVGYMGTKLTWKSSCGGYAYTVMDGNNENIEFTCVPSSNVTTQQISGKGFKYAYWQCYDGTEHKAAQNVDAPCKSSEVWQEVAMGSCKDRCSSETNKCGVNSFSVSNECYIEAGTGQFFTTTPVTTSSGGGGGQEAPTPISTSPEMTTPVVEKEEMLICKDSCPLEEKCYPFGYRKDGNYCSDEGAFKEQFTENAVCENNFECLTNVCVDGKCMSSSLIQKIIDFFTSLFGSK